MAGKFSSRDKMREAQRECNQREWVYRKRVQDGKMTQAEADKQMELMREIAADYGTLAEAEDKAGRLI